MTSTFLGVSAKGKNRRKPWPAKELSPKLAFPGIKCQLSNRKRFPCLHSLI